MIPRAPILLAALALTALSLPAQEADRGPDGGTTTHVSGVEVLAIPGRPFSGKSNIEWTRTLEDGTTVTTHLEAYVARDSQGRVYRERRAFVPTGSNQTSRLEQVHIYDPVTRTQTLCTLATFQCVRTEFAPQTFFHPSPAGWNRDNTRYLASEALGSDMIQGQTVLGTRETTTTNPGVIGNDRPLVSTREFWYSPDLETNLAVTRIDPRTGTQVIRLTELSLSEPNPELFKAPIGFAVRDAREARPLGTVFGKGQTVTSSQH